VRYTGAPLVRGRRDRVRLEAMAAAGGCGIVTTCLPGTVAAVFFTP
jgi:hypothetical protein